MHTDFVEDKRQHRRYRTARYIALVKPVQGLAALMKPREAAVIDINCRGLRMVSNKAFRVGERVILALCSDIERIHGVQARVCHLSQEKGEFHIGLVFVDPVQHDQLSQSTESLLNSVEQVVVHQLH